MCFNFLSCLIIGCSLNASISHAFPAITPRNTSGSNLFDSSKHNQKIIVNKIILSGNKITKANIIYRELLFKEGDTIVSKNLLQILEQSRKNLLNTSLFNFVTIDTTSVTGGKINVSIDVVERWYIWPIPFFQLSDRNFNVWWKTKDLRRIDYGLYLTWDNFRGRKESLVIQLRHGFDETYSLSYKIPYINKSKTIGLGFTAGFTGNHTVAYENEENKQVFYKDEEHFVQKNIFGTFNITYRRNIFNTHTFQINYNQYDFADTLLQLNSGFSNKNIVQYLTFYYLFKSDHRDDKAYPLNGYYFDLEAVKDGFGILKNENIDIAHIHTSVRKFWKLHKRWYFEGGMNVKISSSAYEPYFIENGLGFGDNYVRSYEYYVINGQNYALLKSDLKFALIPTKVKYFKFIPAKKFSLLHYALYLNLLADGAYVSDRQAIGANDLTNSFLFGYGLGLDFVTYYDKVLRVEYSINKMGQGGIFLHFVAPI